MRFLVFLIVTIGLGVLSLFLLRPEPLNEGAGGRQDVRGEDPAVRQAPAAPNRPQEEPEKLKTTGRRCSKEKKTERRFSEQKKTGSLAVLVLDDQDRPVKNAQVTLLAVNFLVTLEGRTFRLKDSSDSRDAIRGETDTRGRITFTGLAPGSWEVTAEKQGSSRSTSSVVLNAGEETHVELRLRQGWLLAGVVVDSRGDPVAGAQVEVMRDLLVVSRKETDAEGKFQTDRLPEGKYSVVAVGGPPGERSRVERRVKLPYEKEIWLVLPTPYAGVITLRVLDRETRKAVKEADVLVRPIGAPQGSPIPAYSRYDGVFEVRLPRNVTDLTGRVKAPGYVQQVLSFKIDRRKDRRIYREVLLQRAAYIVPVLLDRRGNEIDRNAQSAAFYCSYRQGDKERKVGSTVETERIAVPPRTDCEVTLVSLRRTEIPASKRPKATVRSGLPGEETRCVLRLPWLGEIICKAACPEEDAEGVVYVSLWKVEEEGAAHVRKYAGHKVKCGDTFRFRRLSPGRYIVRVDPSRLLEVSADYGTSDNGRNRREILLTEGSDPVEVSLRLEGVVRTAIRVLDRRGRLVRARLHVRYEKSFWSLDPAESFAVYAKRGEKLTVRAYDRLEGVSELLDIDPAGGEYELTLRPFFGVLLKVLTPEGKQLPPESYQVEIADTGGKGPSLSVSHYSFASFTTLEGNIFARLPGRNKLLISDAGTYRLRIVAPPYKSETVEVDVPPDRTPEVEVILEP